MGDNICLSNTDKVSRFGVFQHNKRVQFVNKCVKEMHIAPALPEKLARNFSGGNQQKGIIAKWIALTPEILILDEPTRGIDVGAKVEIYNLICDLTQKGISVLMISSEMMEIIGLCDRVLVMCDGRITGEFSKEEMDQEKILMAATKHAE